MITYVDDLLLTGWQHHIDAITKALLAKYVMRKSGSLRSFINMEGQVVFKKAHAPPAVDEKLGEEEGTVREKNDAILVK